MEREWKAMFNMCEEHSRHFPFFPVLRSYSGSVYWLRVSATRKSQKTKYLLYRFFGNQYLHEVLPFPTLRGQRKFLKVTYIASVAQKRDPKQNLMTRDL